MSELVRVARDGGSIIVKTDDGVYVRTASDGTSDRDTASRISVLTAGGGWRRVTTEDQEVHAEAAILAAGKIFVENAEPKTKIYRVPPSVQKSIQSALETYAPLLADGDREIAGRLSSKTQVERSDIEWMHKFFENIEKALALHGGRRGQTWARKVLSDENLTAAAATHAAFEEEDVLFIAGTDNDEALFDTLYMVDPTDGTVYVWENNDFAALELKDGEIEREHLLEIDQETAQLFSAALETTSAVSLADLNPTERNLFELAESEMDMEYLTILADATGYSPVERSVNAQRQVRGPGGKFGEGGAAPASKAPKAFAKAKLPARLPLVENPAALIEQYLAGDDEQPVTAGGVRQCSATPPPSGSCGRWTERGSDLCLKHGGPTKLAPAPVTAAATGTAPLYLAIVDPVDKTAVMDVVSIVKGENGEAESWRREGGQWAQDNNVLADLRGDTPPPLVELTDDGTVRDVLAQVDASDGSKPKPEPTESDLEQEKAVYALSVLELADFDAEERDKLAKKGYALPDGSFPIKNESDLKNAISAYGRAKDKTAARKHIRKRARALNRTDLIPDSWKELAAEEPVVVGELYGTYGEVLTASGVPGVADTPEDFRNVARLKRYWAFGPGTAKWAPGTPGDWTRLRRALSKYVSPKIAPGLATNIYQMRFGESNAARDKRVGH